MNKAKRAKLERAVKAGYKARNELDAYQSALKDKANKKLIGTCYRFRNSYGGEENWWLYAKISGSEDGFLNLMTFEKTSRGQIEIRPSETRSSLDGYKLITPEEFNQAWLELMTELGGLNK